jgi:hypothetical protein
MAKMYYKIVILAFCLFFSCIGNFYCWLLLMKDDPHTHEAQALRRRTVRCKCTGNGLVVPSSSHKQEVAGSIPSGCTKTFLFPLPLLPHRLMSHFDVWRHLSFHENPHKTSQQQDNSSTRPRGEKKVLPLQSTGEERKEENNSTLQLVNCQYWYKL